VTCPGPFACPFPEASQRRAGDRWTCPGCSTRYVLTRRRYWRRSLREFPWLGLVLPLAVAITLSCWTMLHSVGMLP
jgi:hypothetical protein